MDSVKSGTPKGLAVTSSPVYTDCGLQLPCKFPVEASLAPRLYSRQEEDMQQYLRFLS